MRSNYSALLPFVVRNSWYFMGDHEAAVRITPVTKLGCHVSLTRPEWLSHLLDYLSALVPPAGFCSFWWILTGGQGLEQGLPSVPAFHRLLALS